MFFSAEDSSSQRLVLFYCIFTNSYCGLVITVLHFTGNLYSIGKYDFFPFITAIIFFEFLKYFIGKKYYRKNLPPILGRSDAMHKKNATKNASKDICKSLGLMISVLTVYFILAILFGAQVFTQHEETFMLSLLLCVLTILPACINLGYNSAVLLLLGQKPSPDLVGEWLLKSIQFTLFGAWLGAFAIPLDWDRPWQEWPISCSFGAIAGFVASNFLTSGYIYSLYYHSRKPGKKFR